MITQMHWDVGAYDLVGIPLGYIEQEEKLASCLI